MTRRTGRALASATAACAFAVLAGAPLAFPDPAQANVQAPRLPADSISMPNAMYSSLLGVPTTLTVGATMDLTLTMHWESFLPIDITSLGISMRNSVLGSSPTQGISILWQDPQTGAWRASDQIDTDSGTWTITEPNGAVTIRAGGTLTVHLQITMAGTAATGIEHINAGQFEFQDADGSNLLKGHVIAHDALATFRFGATVDNETSTQPTPPASASPTKPTTAVPAQPTHTTVPSPPVKRTIPFAIVGKVSSPTPNGAASPTPLPLSRTPSSDTITEANIAQGGVGSVSAFGVILVMMAFLAGSALVIARSRRSTLPPDD